MSSRARFGPNAREAADKRDAARYRYLRDMRSNLLTQGCIEVSFIGEGHFFDAAIDDAIIDAAKSAANCSRYEQNFRLTSAAP